ncbi:hypothetical protein HAX54_013164 [Datura stramonium]|uniref:Uncharacterized protein n=1 Tax=Datura stramonium TaxID=4076 RepID=A0ABS8Y5M1_DATST|nr:hypothetical protein [Datura stramonium]
MARQIEIWETWLLKSLIMTLYCSDPSKILHHRVGSSKNALLLEDSPCIPAEFLESYSIWFCVALVKAGEGTDSSSPTAEKMNEVNRDSCTVDEKLRNMLINVLVDNGKLRKQVNLVIRYALKKKMSSPGESEVPSSETVQNKHLDR